jgi:hypothetical protein
MSSDALIPNFDWYANVSSARGLSPRCPFANVKRCPRYWQSLSLLGDFGGTKLDAKLDAELRRFWERSDHWPATMEYSTAIAGGKDEHGNWTSAGLSNFCPETTYDRFGYFAFSMSKYADEIDAAYAHERLSKDHVPASDPRWKWEHVRAMHYCECPYYSVLRADSPKSNDEGVADVTLPFLRIHVKRSDWQRMKTWMERAWRRLWGRS